MKQIIVLISLLVGFHTNAQKKLSADDLIQWDFYGKGIAKVDHKQIYMSEAVNTDGVMLVSPEKYAVMWLCVMKLCH